MPSTCPACPTCSCPTCSCPQRTCSRCTCSRCSCPPLHKAARARRCSSAPRQPPLQTAARTGRRHERAHRHAYTQRKAVADGTPRVTAACVCGGEKRISGTGSGSGIDRRRPHREEDGGRGGTFLGVRRPAKDEAGAGRQGEERTPRGIRTAAGRRSSTRSDTAVRAVHVQRERKDKQRRRRSPCWRQPCGPCLWPPHAPGRIRRRRRAPWCAECLSSHARSLRAGATWTPSAGDDAERRARRRTRAHARCRPATSRRARRSAGGRTTHATLVTGRHTTERALPLPLDSADLLHPATSVPAERARPVIRPRTPCRTTARSALARPRDRKGIACSQAQAQAQHRQGWRVKAAGARCVDSRTLRARPPLHSLWGLGVPRLRGRQAPPPPGSDLPPPPPPPPLNAYGGGFGAAYGYDDDDAGSNQTDGVHDVRGGDRARGGERNRPTAACLRSAPISLAPLVLPRHGRTPTARPLIVR